ncbi:MAG: nucleotidyltransferase domain-containing protein [Promethearchaeati archaeon SRVP18_Atabeyarchaeia-1]
MDREQILAQLRENGPRLNREYGVSLIVLFGSVASGYSAKGMNLSSDIDIAIYLSAGKQDGRRSDRLGSKLDDYLFDAHLLLIGEFTDLLRTDSVDVVLINESPAALKYEIFTKGILAYQGNETEYEDQYLAATEEYYDLMPMLQDKLKEAQEYLSEGRSGGTPTW